MLGQLCGQLCIFFFFFTACVFIHSFLSTFHLCALQDKWLLHSVLMLVQSWIEPLVYLQTSLDRYDAAPDMLLNKTKWVSEKLISLEQGVVVLIKKVGEIPLLNYCCTAKHTLACIITIIPFLLLVKLTL